MLDADIADFNIFLREFENETDRGAALVGAAVIDHRLIDTLRAFMVSNKAAGRLLDGGKAPLGTFSARIDATYALGLINTHEEHELHLIRKIRNEFAHRKHGTTFADPKISSLCDRLKSDLAAPRESYEPRHLFINAVILTSLALTYRAEHVASERRVAPIPVPI
jgi:DNA-binding MltR family transcriptional regulator